MKKKIINFLRIHWDAVLASLVGCLFIYCFTRHSSIGISPDSVIYESVAANIKTHFSFTDFNGLPMVDFPLGYPFFLAMSSWLTGIPILQIAPSLNCLLFAGVILLSSIIIAGYQPTSRIYKFCFLALLACSPCLLEIYSMLWSETLFIFLILLFIVVFKDYFKTHSAVSLSIAGIIVAMAFVTRYAGISLLGTGLFLLLFDKQLVTPKKIKHLFLFGLTGCSLVMINLVRNNYTAGHITGVREKALRSFVDNIQQAGAVFSDWLPFLRGRETLAAFFFVMILAAGIVVLLRTVFQKSRLFDFETVVTGFFVVYACFLLLIATFSRFENLSSRLLSPLYIPMLLVLTSWVMPLLKRPVPAKKMIPLLSMCVVYAGFHYNHYRQNAEAWEGIKDAGMPGYTEDSWTQSPAVAYVKKNKDHITAPVYANANDAVYFLTGIHALSLPHKEIAQEVNAFLQQPSFYLIWFNNGENEDLVGIDFIKQHKRQISFQPLEGGAVYFFADSTNNIASR